MVSGVRPLLDGVNVLPYELMEFGQRGAEVDGRIATSVARAV
jgi:hypothetical protein